MKHQWLKNNWMYLLLLTVIVFLCYFNALGNGFVSDDRGILININTYNFETVFSQPYMFVRPLLYFVTYKIAGLNPFLFRLPNILMHVGIVWLIFAILMILSKRPLAFLAAAIFAVHPILVESVSWISGGVYVQYSFFFLLSFFFYLIGRGKMKYYIVALIAFVFSLMSSEKAIVLALLFPLYEFTLGNLKNNWKKIPLFFILSAMWFFFHSLRLGQREQYVFMDQMTEPSFINPLLQVPITITSYLELLFWPNNLTLYHTEMIFTQMDYIIRLVLTVIFVGVLCYTFFRNKFIFFWISFFLISLLPTLIFSFKGLAWIVAERYVYLGALGIFVVIAWVFTKAIERKKWRKLIIPVFVIIVIVLSIRTIVRNIDWANEDNLWLAAARTSPSSSQNHNNLGDYYGRHGDLVNSIKEFQQAIALKPNYADAHHNLGNAYRDMGRIDDALEEYKKAAQVNPGLWQSYQNIAAIYYYQGNYQGAKEYLEIGLKINPQNTSLLYVLGLVEYKFGDKEKAKHFFIQVLQLDPNNQLTKQALQKIQSE